MLSRQRVKAFTYCSRDTAAPDDIYKYRYNNIITSISGNLPQYNKQTLTTPLWRSPNLSKCTHMFLGDVIPFWQTWTCPSQGLPAAAFPILTPFIRVGTRPWAGRWRFGYNSTVSDHWFCVSFDVTIRWGGSCSCDGWNENKIDKVYIFGSIKKGEVTKVFFMFQCWLIFWLH